MCTLKGKNMGTSPDKNRIYPNLHDLKLSELWQSIIEQKLLIISIILTPLICALIYTLLTPPIYQIKAHLNLNLLKELFASNTVFSVNDLSSILGKIDKEKRNIIFSEIASELDDIKIIPIKGSPEKFTISIESANRDILNSALQKFIAHIKNIREIKKLNERSMAELEFRIQSVKSADSHNDFQIKEIEKRLKESRILPVGFNPVEVNNKSVELKTEIYRLEYLRKNYEIINFLEDPFIPSRPVKPNKLILFTGAAVLGLVLGIFCAFIISFRKREYYTGQ
jgi:LPS O-antigen subunit length determinant protein (WzzB/FepE family)